jgi:hypothetical protein
MYHVNPGKMDELKARFGNHTDAIFKQHNMKSIGYWGARRSAQLSEPVHLHFGAPKPARNGEKLGRFSSGSRVEKSEGRIGGEGAAGGAYRPVFYRSDQFFGAELGPTGGDQLFVGRPGKM